MTGTTNDASVREMTLSEKIGQMTQVSNDAIDPEDVAEYAIGSVLSGGNGNPSPNSPETWVDMVGDFAEAATRTRLGIPLLYGVDAVHGHGNVRGATVFPHNIGLGAIGDASLVEEIGRATAIEMRATLVDWAFAPTVAVAQDIRWGRTYESFGRDPALVSRLGAALITGMSSPSDPARRVLACAKHFVGDGGAQWGTVERKPWMSWWDGWGEAWNIDQGDTSVSEEELRERHLGPYVGAIAAGVMSIMASYSSWNGVKLHSHAGLLTDTLKHELGYEGFVISDWMGVDQISADYEDSVVQAINAGIDMVMVPIEYRRFITILHDAVADGRVPMERIDDAVTRILRAKRWLRSGTRDHEVPPLTSVGSREHRQLAATAARRSAVLLKNDRALPFEGGRHVLVAGRAADDIGLQCGGWTVGWQGGEGETTPGVTFLDALRERFDGTIVFDPTGEDTLGAEGDDPTPDIGIVCVAEDPYAEGPGDRAVPDIRAEDRMTFERVRQRCRTLVVIVYSGRPLVLGDIVDRSDAVIAAWLPGSEATELPDLVLGRSQFEGRLTQPWPDSPEDLDPTSTTRRFPIGHGLRVPELEMQ
jgi:beta-glucosidase